MNLKSHYNLFVLAALLQILWGLVPSASTIVLSEIPVELYITLRWSISGSIFLFVLLSTHTQLRSLWRKETLAVSALGVCGYGLASFGTLYGLKIGGISNFALMTALSPIISSLLSIFILKERPRKMFFFALPLCVTGLGVTALGKHFVSGWHVAISSALLILAGCFLESLVFVYSKKSRTHFSSTQYLAVSQLSAALFMWMLQWGWLHQLDSISRLSLRGWGATFFVALVACVLCFWVLYWLLSRMDGHRLALFDGLHAVSAALFGYLIFNEVLNPTMVAGGVLILAGITLGNLSFKEKKTTRGEEAIVVT